MLQKGTLDYYDKNAKHFVQSTISVDFSETQDKFLMLLPAGGMILDLGCGSGRDTKYFHDKGFDVDAVDGSAELCKIASEFTGLHVKQMLFDELCEVEKYDGIWACSSILHLERTSLQDVLYKIIHALKKDGIIYTSFKYGDYEGVRNGRYFTDFTIESFEKFISNMDEIRMREFWITRDVRPGRGDEKWLNLILQKSDIH